VIAYVIERGVLLWRRGGDGNEKVFGSFIVARSYSFFCG